MTTLRHSSIVILCTGLLAATCSVTQGQIAIDVGAHNLLPNTPNQLVTLNVTGVSLAAGLDFYVQIGDGYPDVPSSSQDGPNITAVDIVTGTLFAGNNFGGQSGSGEGLQHQYRAVLTESGTVSGDGLLASLRIDTTGFNAGSWSLNLGAVYNGPTQFLDQTFNPISVNITEGSITVVPEPAEYGVALGLLAFGLSLYRRFKE